MSEHLSRSSFNVPTISCLLTLLSLFVIDGHESLGELGSLSPLDRCRRLICFLATAISNQPKHTRKHLSPLFVTMADSHASRYSAQRLASREHIPAYPRGFIALRIVQLALGLIALGLCAFGAYLWPISGNCLMLFVAVATLIVTVWLVVAEYSLPCIYNYWAVLALDIFLVVFWLCAFALLASQAAFVFSGTTYCNVYDCYSSEPTGLYFVFAACMAAASAIGGLQL